MKCEGEMRFYPTGRPEVVARSGLELAREGIHVPTHVVAQALGENHAQDYEQALREQRQEAV